MATPIHFGISTCPNDTFLFHALLHRKVDAAGLDLRIDLLDVQELNRRFAAGEFDAAKGSFHAALRLSAQIVVLPVGAALGFGVGPLLLAATRGDDPARPRADGTPARVLCPGEATTATLLYQLYHAGQGRVEQTVFDRIMPALERGTADFGVCIHEGRFTWRERGLFLLEDLGERWERDAGVALPLGGLFARRSLGADIHARLIRALRASLNYAHGHRAETLATMRQYAQELDDAVIQAHVDLYVNEWTRDLGETGRRALAQLAARARDAGAIGDDAAPLAIAAG